MTIHGEIQSELLQEGANCLNVFHSGSVNIRSSEQTISSFPYNTLCTGTKINKPFVHCVTSVVSGE